MVKGNNDFALELYAQLKNRPGDFCFSPVSISTILAMVYTGARGQTAGEIANTMHFTLPPEKYSQTIGKFLHDLNTTYITRKLIIANAVWGEQTYGFLDNYFKTIKTSLNTEINMVDFKGVSEQAGLSINSWVERNTENMLLQTINPKTLNFPPVATLRLTNTVYFKDTWQTPFNKTLTNNFYNSFDKIDKKLKLTHTSAKVMHTKGQFKYLTNSDFQMIELPYKGNNLSMIVLLPNLLNDITQFENSLTAANLKQWLEELDTMHTVDVSLPKLKIIATFEFEDIFGRLGMRRPFLPGRADFSAISASNDLSIHHGENLVYFIADEDSTQAAAQSIAVQTRPFLAVREVSDPEFRADHPFVFFIRDNNSGAILFMGRFVNQILQ